MSESAAVAHGLVLGGVGPELGAVDRDVPEPDQSGGPTQPEHLLEQAGQRRLMALAEIADRPEVRPVQTRHRHDVQPLLARPGQLPAGVEPAAVPVEKKRRQHAGVVGRLALCARVRPRDRRQVQTLAHRVPHEMRKVTRRYELVDRRRQQPDLIHVPCAKALAHGRKRIKLPDRPLEDSRTGS
jgi:hypothetical protein